MTQSKNFTQCPAYRISGDLTDSSNLTCIVQVTQPDEIYNLGAQSHVDAMGTPIIRTDHHYFCPTGVETLLGDSSKAKEKLGWVPEITLDEMVQEMVASDLADAKKHVLLKQQGYQIAVSVE